MTRLAPSRFHRPSAGYTIAETVIATGVLAVLMMAIAALSMFTARSFETLGNYSALDRESRYAIDVLGKDIRRAARVEYLGTNQIVLVYADPDYPSVTNTWDPATRHLTRDSMGIRRNLLTQCDSLDFKMFRRNAGNEFAIYPTSDPALAKLIGVTWRCTRTNYGQLVVMENWQNAKFTIRN